MATAKQLMTTLTLTVFVVSVCVVVDVLYLQVSLTLTVPDKHAASIVGVHTAQTHRHRKVQVDANICTRDPPETTLPNC